MARSNHCPWGWAYVNASKIQIPSFVLVWHLHWGSRSWTQAPQFLGHRKPFFHLLQNRLSGLKEQVSSQIQKFSTLAVHWDHQEWGWGSLKKKKMPRLPPKPTKTQSLGMGLRCQHFYKLPGDSNEQTRFQASGANRWQRNRAGGCRIVCIAFPYPCAPQTSANSLKGNVNKR